MDVHGERLEQCFRRCGTAGLEQREIFRHKAFSLVFVQAIEREHQELAEDVAVAVEAGVDEVRDVGPAPAVAFRDLDASP